MLLFNLHALTMVFFAIVLLGGIMEAREHNLRLGRSIGLLVTAFLFASHAGACVVYLMYGGL